MAVFCGGEAGAEWPAHVGALGAAYLMRDLGFEAGAADAWVRMACPALYIFSKRFEIGLVMQDDELPCFKVSLSFETERSLSNG